jgi:hypothetical protein
MHNSDIVELAEIGAATYMYKKDPQTFGNIIKSYLIFSLIALVIFAILATVMIVKFGRQEDLNQ